MPDCVDCVDCVAAGDGYQGINSVFISEGGLPFELQFHTPESIAVKEEECHVSYEKFRTAHDVGKAIQYWVSRAR